MNAEMALTNDELRQRIQGYIAECGRNIALADKAKDFVRIEANRAAIMALDAVLEWMDE